MCFSLPNSLQQKKLIYAPTGRNLIKYQEISIPKMQVGRVDCIKTLYTDQ